MGPGEILLIVACSAIVISVVISYFIRKKQGKTCCGDCSSCGGTCSCNKKGK
ncbi:MAG: FeoB-associated Cys-rich membrane protein [Clostridia bacterium]|nr:FeoB-associated Cys-rich membrane protein [Clostridia bacterium]MBQ7914572.1 FeoB-associated Cys-rich membrane protein [Clostridia bacterium]MBQ8505689.1 FeoB-associated Cys-rich membrane protein [Clostridia bacterium]